MSVGTKVNSFFFFFALIYFDFDLLGFAARKTNQKISHISSLPVLSPYLLNLLMNVALRCLE